MYSAGRRVGRGIKSGSTMYGSPLLSSPLLQNLKSLPKVDVCQVQLKKPYYEPYFKATAPLLIESESKLQIRTLH